MPDNFAPVRLLFRGARYPAVAGCVLSTGTLTPTTDCPRTGYFAEMFEVIFAVANLTYTIVDGSQMHNHSNPLAPIDIADYDTDLALHTPTLDRFRTHQFSLPVWPLQNQFVYRRPDLTPLDRLVQIYSIYPAQFWILALITVLCILFAIGTSEFLLNREKEARIRTTNLWLTLRYLIPNQANSFTSSTFSGRVLVIILGLFFVASVGLFQGLILTNLLFTATPREFASVFELSKAVDKGEHRLTAHWENSSIFSVFELKAPNFHRQMLQLKNDGKIAIVHDTQKAFQMILDENAVQYCSEFTRERWQYMDALRYCELAMLNFPRLELDERGYAIMFETRMSDEFMDRLNWAIALLQRRFEVIKARYEYSHAYTCRQTQFRQKEALNFGDISGILFLSFCALMMALGICVLEWIVGSTVLWIELFSGSPQ